MDHTPVILALAFMSCGFALGGLAVVGAIVWRRPEIKASDVFVAGHYAVSYPARFVREDRVSTVRLLRVVSIGLMVGGLLILLAFNRWRLS